MGSRRGETETGFAGRKKRRLRLSFYSGAVLLVLLLIALLPGRGDEDVLFRRGSDVTLYAKTELGVKPELNAAKYFPEDELDPLAFTYGWENCDLATPGEYQIPVYYGGEETDCVIRLEVLPEGRGLQVPEHGKGDGSSLRNQEEPSSVETESE